MSKKEQISGYSEDKFAGERSGFENGTVFLVGAGPGDPGLITAKGIKCIEKSHVLVYDRLVNGYLLNYALPGTELVYAGKSSEEHFFTQDEINELLLQKSRQGFIVTRLKGGDPFLFGRGGEEVEFLARYGIPFEVVPGISSAVAVPAYAGIPLTHRLFSSGVSIFSGRLACDKDSSLPQLSKEETGAGTLVFLMGAETLSSIVSKLMEHDHSPFTPVALIRWGTRPEQQVITGCLDDIVSKAAAVSFKPPAVIVVGEVVTLREKLAWLEKKPLFGKRIVITRPRQDAFPMGERIMELGGEPFVHPLIEIQRPFDCSNLDNAIEKINEFDWLIFTSANGVKSFFSRMKVLRKDIRFLKDIHLCAIGPGTAQVLEDKGLLVEYMPEEYRAEKIVESIRASLKPGHKVLLPSSDKARPTLAQMLSSLDAEVHPVTAYRTEVLQQNHTSMIDLLEQKGVHAVTFTSSTTVQGFVEVLKQVEQSGKAVKKLLDGVVLASIGPITTKAAEEQGLKITVEAEEYTVQGLVAALEKYFKIQLDGY